VGAAWQHPIDTHGAALVLWASAAFALFIWLGTVGAQTDSDTSPKHAIRVRNSVYMPSPTDVLGRMERVRHAPWKAACLRLKNR
jgi:threonine/homoserine efflux transporter RhtA